MSWVQNLTSIAAADSKRIIAHVLPGFLLFLGILLLYDSLVPDSDRISTRIFLSAAPSDANITAVMTGGFFAGLVLGLMIDTIGHNFFEERIFGNHILKDLKTQERKVYSDLVNGIDELREAFNLRGISTNSIEADDLYVFTDEISTSKDNNTASVKVPLKDYLINQYYSYYENYQNSGLAIALVSPIFAVYANVVLGFPKIGAALIFGVAFIVSCLLLASAAHTLMDYRKNRMQLIRSLLIKQYMSKTSEASLNASNAANAAADQVVKVATAAGSVATQAENLAKATYQAAQAKETIRAAQTKASSILKEVKDNSEIIPNKLDDVKTSFNQLKEKMPGSQQLVDEIQKSIEAAKQSAEKVKGASSQIPENISPDDSVMASRAGKEIELQAAECLAHLKALSELHGKLPKPLDNNSKKEFKKSIDNAISHGKTIVDNAKEANERLAELSMAIIASDAASARINSASIALKAADNALKAAKDASDATAAHASSKAAIATNAANSANSRMVKLITVAVERARDAHKSAVLAHESAKNFAANAEEAAKEAKQQFEKVPRSAARPEDAARFCQAEGAKGDADRAAKDAKSAVADAQKMLEVVAGALELVEKAAEAAKQVATQSSSPILSDANIAKATQTVATAADTAIAAAGATEDAADRAERAWKTAVKNRDLVEQIVLRSWLH